MLRTIGGVLGGCIAIVIVVVALFSLAYSIMGPERAFLPGSYSVSSAWIMLNIVVSLLAAVIGGLVSAFIGKETKAPIILAGLVLVICAFRAVHEVRSPAGQMTEIIRESNVSSTQAMQHSRQPAWIAFLNPVIGFTGVLAGARLRKS